MVSRGRCDRRNRSSDSHSGAFESSVAKEANPRAQLQSSRTRGLVWRSPPAAHKNMGSPSSASPVSASSATNHVGRRDSNRLSSLAARLLLEAELNDDDNGEAPVLSSASFGRLNRPTP